MRVAMVCTHFSPHVGGIETHVAEVAPRLAGRGFEVEVLTLDPGGELAGEEARDGYRVRRFSGRPRAADICISRGLAAAVARESFDLIHIQGVHTLVAPMVLAATRGRNRPVVLSFHTGGSSSALRHRARGAQWRAESTLLRRASRLVAVCEYERGLFSRALRIDPGRIDLVRNGADPLPIGEATAVPAGDPLVCSFGRLETYKGHHRLIGAMPDLLARAPGARLVVVGTGPAAPRLRAQARALGVGDRVEFASFAPSERAALGALIAAADVVALMSEYEAHPVAIVEALALGTDVVVADTSGLTELGVAGLARAVPLCARAEALADELLAAARERRWRAGPPALPSWDDCADALAEIYLHVRAVPCAS